MINQNYLWVVVGVLTIGIAVALQTKGVKVKPKAPADQPAVTRPADGDWNGGPPPPPTNPPVAPPMLAGPKTYKEAIDQSAKANKPLLLFFTAKGCQPCQKMKRELAPSLQTVAGQIVYYEVDADVERDVVRKYSVDSTPTYLIVNGQEQILKSGVGYKDVKAFGEWLAAPYSPPSRPQVDPPTQPSQPGPPTRPQRQPLARPG